jgi:prohibitin 1
MMMSRYSLAALTALLLVGCGQVDPGERAVFTRWGVMDQRCYPQGFYWYNPISTNMDDISVQTQKFEAKALAAATSDVQEVHADITVQFRIDGDKCHLLLTEIGHDYGEKVLRPTIFDALKAGTSHFNLATIIRDREKLREIVRNDLKARLAWSYLQVQDVNLTNFSVSPAFAAAVEAKQIEEQRAEQRKWLVIQAERDAEVRAAGAKGLADAAREKAKGDADALRTTGQAQAEYNAKVSQSLTPILVQQQTIEAWRAGGSHVPQIQSGGGMLLQVPVPKSSVKE